MVRDQMDRERLACRQKKWRDVDDRVTANETSGISSSLDPNRYSTLDNGSKVLEEHVVTIYKQYPRRVGKDAAIKAIERALRNHKFEDLLAAVKEFAQSEMGRSGQYCPYPSTWFNQKRWNDDRANWNPTRKKSVDRVPDFDSPEMKNYSAY
jgi:hypothetical protein